MTHSERIHRAAAAIAALAYAGLAITVTAKGTGEGHYEEPFEYVIGSLFLLALLSVAVAVGTFRDRSPRGTMLVVLGGLLVAFGVGWGTLAGEDPAWFALFGVPGNVLMLVGFVLLARRVRHEGKAGRVLAVLLVACVPLSLVAAEIGGGLVAALLWGLVAAGVAEERGAKRELAEAVVTA
jgi:hypothetical protein